MKTLLNEVLESWQVTFKKLSIKQNINVNLNPNFKYIYC